MMMMMMMMRPQPADKGIPLTKALIFFFFFLRNKKMIFINQQKLLSITTRFWTSQGMPSNQQLGKGLRNVFSLSFLGNSRGEKSDLSPDKQRFSGPVEPQSVLFYFIYLITLQTLPCVDPPPSFLLRTFPMEEISK